MKKCQSEYDKDPERETDFHLYFKAIIKPEKIYKIVCDQSPRMPDFGSLSG
jgi:hypothetical protein